MYNEEGECGTGAVVPWAGRLWVITYGPHKPMGSSDKLYEITPGLKQFIRPESIGGTPANRMIHKESNQLSIGPYFIDQKRKVRAIPYSKMPGRHTGTARHLKDPARKVYIATMEEGLYSVDVHDLSVLEHIKDGNPSKKFKGPGIRTSLPGYHGKGLYSSQGALVYSNNGERGKKRGQRSYHDFRRSCLVAGNRGLEPCPPKPVYGSDRTGRNIRKCKGYRSHLGNGLGCALPHSHASREREMAFLPPAQGKP